ncbi:MAG: response regulator [Candidatus Saccharibacteria bacterium]
MKKILIVDDQALIRKMVRSALSGRFMVLEADGPKACMQVLLTTTIDLIIMDMVLEDSTGLDLVRQIREVPSIAATPIVLLTSDSQESTRSDAKALGIQHFIAKPFEQPVILTEILKIFGEAPATAVPRISNPISSETRTIFFKELREMTENLHGTHPVGDGLHTWYRFVHTMFGTAGTVGFSMISERLNPWESRLHDAVEGNELNEEEIQACEELLEFIDDFLTKHDTDLEKGVITAPDQPPPETVAGQVLLVEDSASTQEVVINSLGELGIKVVAVGTGSAALMELNGSMFDLILLDIMLPDTDGFKLFETIRSDPRWELIPIVFLSAKAELEDKIAGWELGADDYITKPFEGSELNARVTGRLRRAGKILQASTRDYLTNALSRRYLDENLAQLAAQTARNSSILSVALLDLDNFKSVNDTYGHQTGDAVLRGLVSFLHNNLRQSDVVGRFGGEEFMIIFPDTDSQNAQSRATELIDGFKKVSFTSPNSPEPFHVSFSAGIASFPQHGDNTQSLVAGADIALYLAKSQGKSRAAVYSMGEGAVTHSTRRILAVDDNRAFLSAITEGLVRRGYEVDAYSEPKKALSVATIGKNRWDVMLVDVNMPEMTGFELVSMIKQYMQNDMPPVIMITTANQVQDLINASKLGVADYVLKPLDIDDLTRRLTAILSSRAPTQQQ